jgi:prevent-host-death family protein
MSKVRRISATEAARNFSDLLNRVFYRGESAVLIRNGVPVARLVPPAPATAPADELARRWQMLPHLTPAEADRLAEDLEEARRALPPAAARWE